ncbi:hypothetical protein [Streptomyces sp. NBC_00859]|uniref:hypothetical protein n=1 Tax=Streptomyces sp. NBC_00859 TaxID=2903682 RepID=UPI00386414F9|nr:hypothetical protein OG584_10970 [Streptomyces sp. NBC_00859]
MRDGKKFPRPRRRTTRATLLPSLLMAVLPLAVVRTIGAHAGPLAPAVPALTGLAVLVSLFLLKFWLAGLTGAGGPAGPAELRRDAAVGSVTACRVTVGPAVWAGEGSGSCVASRRLMLSGDGMTIALRTPNEESPQFPWLDLESAGVQQGREAWLCWAEPKPTWVHTVSQVCAALVTDDGCVVWGSTERGAAEIAYRSGRCSSRTAPRRVRRSPRVSLYRPDVHGYTLAMAALTLLALLAAERGLGPDPLSWCLALLAAFTGVRAAFGFTERLADRPGPGWAPAPVRGRRGRRSPEAPPAAR